MVFSIFDEDLQRAALAPDRWPELQHGIAQHAGALGSILISEAHRIPVPPISRELEPLMARYYGEGWHTADIRFRGVDIAIRTGAVTDQQILTPEEIARSSYYQDLLRPEKCCWFCSIHLDVAGSPWFLTLQRTIGQGPFTPEEVAHLSTLRRPIQATASLSHALSFAQVSGMTDAFDHLGKSALILDERFLLLRCNGGAKRVLDALADIRHGEIRFRHGTNQQAFESALGQAGSQAVWSGPARRRTVLKDMAGRNIVVEATTLGDWARYSFTQASVLVFFEEVRAEPLAPQAILRARYGLTPAETRVAESLAAGLSVRALADRHQITYQTARTHLKSVLAKTGTRRQTELVSLLLSEPRQGD